MFHDLTCPHCGTTDTLCLALADLDVFCSVCRHSFPLEELVRLDDAGRDVARFVWAGCDAIAFKPAGDPPEASQEPADVA